MPSATWTTWPSTHPPETAPAILPASLIAIFVPGGCGADFFVSTTVASATGSPAPTQSPTTSITSFIRVQPPQASVPTSRSSPCSETCS